MVVEFRYGNPSPLSAVDGGIVTQWGRPKIAVMFAEYRALYIRESREHNMGISRRFRWVICLGGLKVLAATVLFVYGKHKAAAPPAPAPVSVRAPAAKLKRAW
jgi:hypothetical protein